MIRFLRMRNEASAETGGACSGTSGVVRVMPATLGVVTWQVPCAPIDLLVDQGPLLGVARWLDAWPRSTRWRRATI